VEAGPNFFLKEAILKGVQKKRWLKALEIAKVLFEDEGYHIQYLEEIESHIKKEEEKTTSKKEVK
jgi:nucleoside 2-deoxyribosyltransferase